MLSFQGARYRAGRFSMLGMIFHRFARALLAECAYWLVTCEIVTSGPRSQRWFPWPLPGSPRTSSWTMEIPGELGFPHDGLCGRRKLLTKSEIPRERLFGQRRKGRVGKARNDIERSCDKTWAILTPRSAHLAMKNAGASIRIGRLGRRDAR